MPIVSDVMQKVVEVFHPDTTLGEAIAKLSERGISGAPVLDKDGNLVGVISEFALMDVLFAPELKDAKVSEYMTHKVHCLKESDSLTHAVHNFFIYGVRRLPVVRDGKLVGIVSRRDLMTACFDLNEPLVAPLQEFMPELSVVSAYSKDSIIEPVEFA